MTALSPDKEDKLSNLSTDVLSYLLLYLRSRDLGKMETVCKRMKEENIVENVAYQQFKKYHPHLSPGLLAKHIKYTQPLRSSYKFLYYSCRCFPSVEIVNKKYQKDLSGRARYHNEYWLEKVFGWANVVLLVNAFKCWKKRKIFDDKKPADVDKFCEYFVRITGKINPGWGEFPKEVVKELREGDNRYRFKTETMLYLLQHHRNDMHIGDRYDALLHCLMMNCIEAGWSHLAVQCRKLGAIIKPDPNHEFFWKYFFRGIHYPYYEDYVWMDFKDPFPPYHNGTGVGTVSELQGKLDARIAMFSVSKIEECAKLKDLELITNSKFYTKRQMVDFLTKLLELDAVSDSIKDSAIAWTDFNQDIPFL